jgi:outer membrane protein OmpA-like peptidoglycan-associated protein
MLEERLLRILIRDILEEQGIKLRTAKGYSASHPVVSRQDTATCISSKKNQRKRQKRRRKK